MFQDFISKFAELDPDLLYISPDNVLVQDFISKFAELDPDLLYISPDNVLFQDFISKFVELDPDLLYISPDNVLFQDFISKFAELDPDLLLTLIQENDLPIFNIKQKQVHNDVYAKRLRSLSSPSNLILRIV